MNLKIVCSSLFLFFILSFFVFATPSNNPIFVDRVSFVDKVGVVDKILKPELSVFGTEYVSGSDGKTFLQVIFNDSAVNNAICHVSIFNPNGSLFLSNQLMSYIVGSHGLYDYDFVVPSVEGVYPISASCQYFLDVNHAVVESFSSDFLVDGLLMDLYEVDDYSVNFSEVMVGADACGLWNLSVDFVFNNIFFQENISFFDVGLYASSSSLLNLSIFNFDSGSFELLPNKFYSSYRELLVSNFVDYNFSSYVNASNNSIFRVGLADNYRCELSVFDYLFFKENGDDLSSYVEFASDSLFVEGNIDGLGRAFKISSVNNLTNDSMLSFRVAPKDVNQVNKTVFIHNVDGSVLYGSFKIDSSAGVFKFYNVSLSNISEGVSDVFLSDILQGGDMKLLWDFISVNDFSYSGNLLVDKVFLRVYGYDFVPYEVKGSGEVHVSNNPLRILDGLDYLSLQLDDNTSSVLSAINSLNLSLSGDYSVLLSSLDNWSVVLNNSWFGWYSDLQSQNYETHNLLSNISIDLNNDFNSLFSQHNLTQELIDDFRGNVSDELGITNSLFLSASYSLNDSINSEFNFLSGLLYSVYNNISSDVSVVSGKVSNVDNDLQTHDSDIKSLLSSLDSDISSLSSQCNNNYVSLDDRITVLEGKIDLLLEKLNVVTSSLNLFAETHDCLEGSVWSIEVVATDNFANYLNFEDINCSITTNLWGTEPLIWSVDSFDYTHECGYGNDTITWVVECDEI